jgi:hypothetical protein
MLIWRYEYVGSTGESLILKSRSETILTPQRRALRLMSSQHSILVRQPGYVLWKKARFIRCQKLAQIWPRGMGRDSELGLLSSVVRSEQEAAAKTTRFGAHFTQVITLPRIVNRSEKDAETRSRKPPKEAWYVPGNNRTDS